MAPTAGAAEWCATAFFVRETTAEGVWAGPVSVTPYGTAGSAAPGGPTSARHPRRTGRRRRRRSRWRRRRQHRRPARPGDGGVRTPSPRTAKARPARAAKGISVFGVRGAQLRGRERGAGGVFRAPGGAGVAWRRLLGRQRPQRQGLVRARRQGRGHAAAGHRRRPGVRQGHIRADPQRVEVLRGGGLGRAFGVQGLGGALGAGAAGSAVHPAFRSRVHRIQDSRVRSSSGPLPLGWLRLCRAARGHPERVANPGRPFPYIPIKMVRANRSTRKRDQRMGRGHGAGNRPRHRRPR